MEIGILFNPHTPIIASEPNAIANAIGTPIAIIATITIKNATRLNIPSPPFLQ